MNKKLKWGIIILILVVLLYFGIVYYLAWKDGVLKPVEVVNYCEQIIGTINKT